MEETDSATFPGSFDSSLAYSQRDPSFRGLFDNVLGAQRRVLRSIVIAAGGGLILDGVEHPIFKELLNYNFFPGLPIGESILRTAFLVHQLRNFATMDFTAEMEYFYTTAAPIIAALKHRDFERHFRNISGNCLISEITKEDLEHALTTAIIYEMDQTTFRGKTVEHVRRFLAYRSYGTSFVNYKYVSIFLMMLVIYMIIFQ